MSERSIASACRKILPLTLLSAAMAAACSGISQDPVGHLRGQAGGGASAGGVSARGGESTGGVAPASGGLGGAAGEGFAGEPQVDSGGGEGGASGGTASIGGGAGESSSAGEAGSNPSGGSTASGGAFGVSGAAGTGGQGGTSGGGNTAGADSSAVVSNERLVYWFSADEGVTETDGAVSEWRDRSGNEVVASQSMAEHRPKIGKFSSSADLNGVDFDGDDYLVLPPVDANFEAGVTFFSVGRAGTNRVCMTMLELSNGSEIDDLAFFSLMETFTYEVFEKVVQGKGGTFTVGAPLLLDVTHTPEQAVSLFVNGTANGSAGFPVPRNITRNQNFLGRSLYKDCLPWAGMLTEILLYARPLPTEERQAVRRYLSQKWDCCG